MGFAGTFDYQRHMQKELDLGRAKNALQDYLVHKLLFPKVYLDAEWKGEQVDVLAIDREGTGDVHAIRIDYYRGDFIESVVDMVVDTVKGKTVTWSKNHDQLTVFKSLPSHFLYYAVVYGKPVTCKFSPLDLSNPELLAEDGVGRIGILYVDLTEDEPSVKVILKAERFRSSKELVELADQYVAAHTANWELHE
jgi:hypothetical protein